jgi:hypothetical protein
MFGIVSKDTPIDLRIIILGIVLLILCGFMFKILFTILHHRLLMILFGIQQGDSMNLTNIGEFARNSVYLSAGDSVLLSAPRSIQNVLFRLSRKFSTGYSVHISIYWNIADSIRRQYETN